VRAAVNLCKYLWLLNEAFGSSVTELRKGATAPIVKRCDTKEMSLNLSGATEEN
jgi:hypothetical protein